MKKLDIRGFAHHHLVAALVIVIVGIVGVQVLASHADTTPVAKQYIAKAADENGCWLAGRKWSKGACLGGANDVGKAAPCRNDKSTFKLRVGTDGKKRGYCTGAVAVTDAKTLAQLQNDENSCVNVKHRVFLYELGCARRLDQDNVNNAPQCLGSTSKDHGINLPATDPYKQYVSYLGDLNADSCVADSVAPPSATTTDPIAQAKCSALGRKYSTKGCERACQPDAGVLLIDNATSTAHPVASKQYYCNKSVAPTISQTRCAGLHRLWVDAGCSRRPDQKDNANDTIHCIAGYPYYHSNSEASSNGTLDVCEKDRATALANQAAGVVGTNSDGSPVVVCKNGQIKQSNGTCACPTGMVIVHNVCQPISTPDDPGNSCPANATWSQAANGCICTANQQPPVDNKCPVPDGTPPTDDGDMVVLESGINQHDCTQLYGRGWELGQFGNGNVGYGCSTSTCAKTSNAAILAVDDQSSVYCKGYGQQISLTQCAGLHRRWVTNAKVCAVYPIQDGKNKTLTGAIQCESGSKFNTYLVRKGAPDQCVKTSTAQQIKYLVSKFDVPFNAVASAGPQLFCNTFRHGDYHWVASTKQCVKDRDTSSDNADKATKVMVFVEENHSLDQMKSSMPYAYAQAKKYGYATNYEAAGHPSLQNYIVMAAGSTMGVTDDAAPDAHKLQGKTVFGEAVAAGKTAKIYAEGMKGNCSTAGADGRYKARHNPWTYFVDERADCKKYDVPLAGNFAKDAKSGNFPNVSMVIPDNCNNAHDSGCTLKRADDWFKKQMQLVYNSPDWKSGRLVVVLTADEDDGDGKNIVLTAVMHPSLDGKVVDTHLTHYSLSRMMAEIAGVAPLREAKDAPSMIKAFNLGSSPSAGPKGSADFRIATFNVLGAAHTDGPHPNAPNKASYGPRMQRAIKILKDNDIDVVGVQEFEAPQRAILVKDAGDKFGVYPRSPDYGKDGASVNSIIWNKDTFEYVDGGTKPFYYFGHSKKQYPWVKLREKQSGRVIVFANTHDPADTQGHAAAIRYEDAKLHLQDMTEFSRQGSPVVLTGDFNALSSINARTSYFTKDRNKLAYCILQSNGVMQHALDSYKGRTPGGKCPASDGKVKIDQIHVDKSMKVKKYVTLSNSDVHFATDHSNVVYADVILR